MQLTAARQHTSGVESMTTTQERRRARDGEFEDYMRGRQPSLRRTAYLLAGDEHTAEDLVQVAFAKLYLSWDRVRDQQTLDGYVRRILVNEHNSLWRRAWKRRELSTDAPPEAPQTTATYDEGQSAALWEFVGTLPRKQRAVVVLRYYEDLSEAETAEVMGISVGTVKSQASRALAGLRSRVHENPALSRNEEEGR